MSAKFLTACIVAASAACFGQSTSAPSFPLAPSQVAAIQQLDADYNKVWDGEQQRIARLGSELIDLVSQQNPDPRELGSRAVSLELIRRERAAAQTVVQAKIAALLTDSQTAALKALVSSVSLQPLADDAACAFLLPQAPNRWFDVQYPTAITGALSFNPFPFYYVSALPYIPPAPTGSFCGSQIFPISVRQYLSLTDAQVAYLYSASADYNDFYARKQNRLTELQLEITDLTTTPNVDPVVLGSRYVEMTQISQQLQAKAVQVRDAAQTQLTPAQSARLKTLKDAQDLLASGLPNRLINCNILVLPEGSSYLPTGLTLSFSSCFL